MYDDFRRAKLNIKRTLAIWRHDPRSSPSRRIASRSSSRLSWRRKSRQGVDLETLSKGDQRQGRHCSPFSTSARSTSRLHNLQTIKTLVTNLRNKITARFLLDKCDSDCTLSPNAFSSFANDKNESTDVSLLVEDILPVLPKSSLPPSLTDFSSILEDVSTLESFLKVIAPMFMNSLLAQKHRKERGGGHDNENEHQAAADDENTGETDNNHQRRPLCVEDQHAQPSQTEAPGPNNIEQSSVRGWQQSCSDRDENMQVYRLAATDGLPLHDGTREEEGRQSSDEASLFPQSNASVDLHVTQLREYALASSDTSPQYPSFEEQYEEGLEPMEENCRPLQPSPDQDNRTHSDLNSGSGQDLDAMKISTKVKEAALSHLLSVLPPDDGCDTNSETFEPLSCPGNYNVEREKQGSEALMLSYTSEAQVNNGLVSILRPSDAITSCARACKLSFPGIVQLQGLGKPMTPLDFNLNALYKSALSEELGMGGDRSLETVGTLGALGGVGSQNTLAAYDAHGEQGATETYNGDQKDLDSETSENSPTIETEKWTESNMLNDSKPAQDTGLCKAIPALDIGTLRRRAENTFNNGVTCTAILTLGVILTWCCNSSVLWELWIVLTLVGTCLILTLALFDDKKEGCLDQRLRDLWTNLFVAQHPSQTDSTFQSNKTERKEESTVSDREQKLRRSLVETPTFILSRDGEASYNHESKHAVCLSTSGRTSCGIRNQNLMPPLHKKIPTQEETCKCRLATVTATSNSCEFAGRKIQVTNCAKQSVVKDRQNASLNTIPQCFHPSISTSTVSTMTEYSLDWMPCIGHLHEPDTSMMETMTETPSMRSSAVQTDGAASILSEDLSDSDAGEMVQVLELPAPFPPLSTATVGVQADMGARKLREKTEKVRKGHQVSLKRLHMKFLSIRRRCQIEAMSLKQCDQKKNDFLCRLQLALPGLQQEKRALLAERAAIEKQFEEEKKKNRELVGRLTRLNHQFCKLGQVQQQLPLPPQHWRQQQQQQQQQQQSQHQPQLKHNSISGNSATCSSSNTGHCSQDGAALLYRHSQQQLQQQQQQQQQQQPQQQQTSRATTSGQEGTSLFSNSQNKCGKPTAASGPAPLSQPTTKVQPQSTLLQTSQVRPNNAAPTSASHLTYQDQTLQQQQQQQQRQQQQQHQILLKQQHILQQQRLPIFQLFNRPVSQMMSENQVPQQSQQQQQQQQQHPQQQQN